MVAHLALIFLEWAGKVIASKLAGTALDKAWRRLGPSLRKLIKRAEEQEAETNNLQTAAEELRLSTAGVDEDLDKATQKIDALQRENKALRDRLSKYEPVDLPPP